ncbi:MAG: hypothetical protein IJV42_01720 [Bacteroidaceae bacterium]|nr:hypothetical protein [Bacteroidaceae bacterium]
MFNDEGLKARVEELEKDLSFYLRYYRTLSKRSKRMKAVVDKEIEQIEQELKKLSH